MTLARLSDNVSLQKKRVEARGNSWAIKSVEVIATLRYCLVEPPVWIIECFCV